MKTPKTYTMPRWFWALPILVSVLILYVWWQPNPWEYKAFMGFMGLVAWYGVISMPMKISIQADNWVVLKSALKTERIPIQDIVAIERNSRSTALRLVERKIEIAGYFPGLEDFCTELKTRNAAITDGPGPLVKFAQSYRWIIILLTVALMLTMLLVALALHAAGKV